MINRLQCNALENVKHAYYFARISTLLQTEPDVEISMFFNGSFMFCLMFH